jgi:hypothetical protein
VKATPVTVTVAVPVTPSTVAVIVALPTAATAVTTPVALTVATAVFPELQVTGRPVSVAPLASRAVAVSCCVPPTARLAVAGVTITVATGTTVTVTAAVPVTPSTVAVIVALPTATAVTTPLLLTVATAVFPELHVTGRPVSVAPLASRALAVSCCVPPTATLAVAGDTLTAATGTGRTVRATGPAEIVTGDVPAPEPVQVIVTDAVPGATAVTTPLLPAETTALFELTKV